MMPECDAYFDLLVDLSDGELAPEEVEKVRGHVAACPRCRGELARLDASLVRLKNAIVERPAVVVTAVSEGRRERVRMRPLPAAAAAAIALACVAAVVWFSVTTDRVPPEKTAAAPGATAPLGSRDIEAEPRLTQAEALRRIAFSEQRARLETSLALMPKEPWYADERAENERLLAAFIAATTAGQSH